MTNKNTAPSIDPADSGTLEGLIKYSIKKAQQNQDGMMPVKVIGYDRKTNRVHVQPLVQVQGTDGQIIDRAPIKSIPAFRFGGGGAMMSFPIQEGDVGYIMAGDRDTSLVEQGDYVSQPPNTDRTHSFENGMFFPDSMKSGGVDEADFGKVVIGSRDGSVKITFDGSEMHIVASSKVTIIAPEVEVQGNVLIKGDVTIEGKLDAQGGITGANGTSFETHVHKGVTAGQSQSQEPVTGS